MVDFGPFGTYRPARLGTVLTTFYIKIFLITHASFRKRLAQRSSSLVRFTAQPKKAAAARYFRAMRMCIALDQES